MKKLLLILITLTTLITGCIHEPIDVTGQLELDEPIIVASSIANYDFILL